VPAVVTRVSDGTAWDGYVHRVEGDIDPATGQINVVVRVPGAYASREGIAPLLVGTFATVGIAGRSLDRYFDVPRMALRENNTVWIAEEGRLVTHAVTVVQETDERALVTAADLPDGAGLIISDLPIVAEQMAVRTTRP
ncbi:MAG: hypothetical protein AAF752_12230, partial [Bacteroidota bacterium]